MSVMIKSIAKYSDVDKALLESYHLSMVLVSASLLVSVLDEINLDDRVSS